MLRFTTITLSQVINTVSLGIGLYKSVYNSSGINLFHLAIAFHFPRIYLAYQTIDAVHTYIR